MRTAINVDKSSLAENECIRNLIYAVLVHRCINSRVNRTRYPRPLHACEASRRLHYAVASQTHR